jgi:small subunit ribosomal protein S16
MALKIRLRQQGRNNSISYRVVVTDSRTPRDGKYVEAIGWYHPIEEDGEKSLFIKADRLQHWLNLGAQLTEKTVSLASKAAPAVMKEYMEKQLMRHTKQVAKRRKARKKTEA